MPDVQYSAGVADRRLFAKDVVRFEGEVVAAVAATTIKAAEEAVAAIEVDYEALPAVTDLELALVRRLPTGARGLGRLRGDRRDD